MNSIEEFKEWYLTLKRDCVVFKYDEESLTDSDIICQSRCGNKMKVLVSIETSKLDSCLDSRGKKYLNINCCTNSNCYDEMFQTKYSFTDEPLGSGPLKLEQRTDGFL